jgi:hypothetical protein
VLEQDEDFVRAEFGGLRVDILLTGNPLFERVRGAHVTTLRFQGRDVIAATATGLLLLKLYALPSLCRQGNFARVALYENDIAMLVEQYRPDVEVLSQELSGVLSTTDLQEVRAIVEEITARIERFEGRFGGAGDAAEDERPAG